MHRRSVSQQFLLRILARIGGPRCIQRIVEGLYHRNECKVEVGGGIFPSFKISAGVRQGCPLSPLLFAIAADLLLRRLQRLLPSAQPRAYADDLALISEDVFQDLPLLQRIFAEYSRNSNLHLNLGKP